jgi:murein peptide amidase A
MSNLEGSTYRSGTGTVRHQAKSYGRSANGVPLLVYSPAHLCDLLVFAGIHGTEPDTTATLSAAMRLTEPSDLACHVVLSANPDGLLAGTRGNLRGVDLNRNFPTADWESGPTLHRWRIGMPRDIPLSAGVAPASEPETHALLTLIERLALRTVVALHSPLACIEDASDSQLGSILAARTGLKALRDVGYPTPGSFGTWGIENGCTVITYEFPPLSLDELRATHAAVLADLLSGQLHRDEQV